MDNLAEAASDRPEQLYEIDGIGEVVARSITEWFLSDDNRKLLEKFKDLGVWPAEDRNSSGPLSGLSFAITGSLDSMKRDEAASRIRALGGTFQTSVGQDTSYLVHGRNLGNSKRQQAAKYGTKLMTETEFNKLLEQG